MLLVFVKVKTQDLDSLQIKCSYRLLEISRRDDDIASHEIGVRLACLVGLWLTNNSAAIQLDCDFIKMWMQICKSL